MKGRESGMPDEVYWETFFDPEAALDLLASDLPDSGNVVEFGCGYGTFTMPVASRTSGIVTALDIEPDMVACVRRRALEANVDNVVAVLRDFVEKGTGLPTGSQSHAMIFNLLHIECPVALLREANRLLMPGCKLSIIHWRGDIPTPRGPSMAIRPTLEQCVRWIKEAGFGGVDAVNLESCCPYHFGIVALR